MEVRGLVLDRFQEEAIRHLQAGRSVLVSAPTGTGKTLVADWIVETSLAAGKSVIYTAPIKALSNQKYRDFCRLHGAERVGLVTGDLVIRRDAPCRVMTTEILRNMLLGDEPLDDLAAVVLDEIHFLDDRERGTTWEEVLIYLPSRVQVVGLSATLANLPDLAEWMEHVRGTEVKVIEEHKRAVPLEMLIASTDCGIVTPARFDDVVRRKQAQSKAEAPQARGRGDRGGRDQRDQRGGRRGPPQRGARTRHSDIFGMLDDAKLLPYLYFAFSRKDTELYARDLARRLAGSLLDEARQKQMDARLAIAARELGAALDPDVRELYRRGVAFHHAGLHVQLKALVEELYEARLIDVLYCTSTFALGINMPARSVVFDALKKFDGTGIRPLTTRQFMQKAGRAGRRGMDTVGHVVIRMDTEDWEDVKPQLERYRKGAYEPVRSSFNLSWNSVVNLLESHADNPDRIKEIVGKSFLSWSLARAAERELSRIDPDDDNKNARRARRRAARVGDRAWDEFQRKVMFLQTVAYIDADGVFNAGAKVLKHLQIAEIPVTELVLCGLFENLDDATWFGLLCALTNELPRGVERNYWLTREDRKLVGEVGNVVQSGLVVEAAEITGQPWTFDPDLIPLGRAWAEGKPLQELLLMVRSATDISGDLITGFRRAKDLLGQLRDVYAEIPDRANRLKGLIRTVSRDEVEVVD